MAWVRIPTTPFCAVRPWPSVLTSLSLSFSLCEMGIMVLVTASGLAWAGNQFKHVKGLVEQLAHSRGFIKF